MIVNNIVLSGSDFVNLNVILENIRPTHQAHYTVMSLLSEEEIDFIGLTVVQVSFHFFIVILMAFLCCYIICVIIPAIISFYKYENRELLSWVQLLNVAHAERSVPGNVM